MNKLNEALFKDLVQSTHFKIGNSVRNPLNIIWMLESEVNLPDTAQIYLDKLKIKENDFNEKSSRKVSGILSKILSQESVFIKRFDYLVNQISSINEYALDIIDLKSINVLEHSAKCGLDMNVEVHNTYLLKYALEIKNSIISNYLFNLPQVDKFKIDNKGNNLAHLVSINKNYKMIGSLSKENIDLFYVKNNAQKTAVDIIFGYKQYDTLHHAIKEIVKNVVLMFLELNHNGKHVLSNETMEIINQSSVLKNIVKEANYHKLDNKLQYKNTEDRKTKISKI